jgi:phosphoribosylaminoimidazolecarboxamide formyltransferase/IMP cyclohydrolase
MQDGGYQLLGMGAGQPNRLISTKLAIEKSRENLKNEFIGDDFEAYVKAVFAESILVSDAFFPFPDNIEIAAAAGIKTVIQPGGSIRDKKVIKACNECGVAMIFSGLRHFKH